MHYSENKLVVPCQYEYRKNKNKENKRLKIQKQKDPKKVTDPTKGTLENTHFTSVTSVALRRVRHPIGIPEDAAFS
jgi:hypothetical protein